MDNGILAARDTSVSESKRENTADYAIEDEEGTDTKPEPEFSATSFERKPLPSISRSRSLLTMELLQTKGKVQERITSPFTTRRLMLAEEARCSGNIRLHMLQERWVNTNPFLRRSTRTGNKSGGKADWVFENLADQGTNRSEARCPSEKGREERFVGTAGDSVAYQQGHSM